MPVRGAKARANLDIDVRSPGRPIPPIPRLLNVSGIPERFTAGFGVSEAYFRKVLDRVRQSIDASNTIVGEYMCQGKMPQAVKERYLKMKEQPEHPANLDMLIENFDRALPHPDAADLEKLRSAILN